ncbi:MAG: ParB/RepB/Spo0J family partition protein [Actinobacteria bacterium]|nr:ParB/RepB/Spo0J family partition protein [Actinomycetota bacterium]
MAKKKPNIVIEDIFKEKDRELTDELFDITTSKGLVNIPIDKVFANPNQPRKTFHNDTISELAESIKEHGVLSPIIVRPLKGKYEIIAGERRYRAAIQNELKEIPAIIKKVSDDDAKIISLIENIQREDLNDIDRAAALKELKVNLGSPWEEIARRLGLTKRRVLDLVGLLSLPEEIQDDIRQKKLTERHGRALRQLVDQDEKLIQTTVFVKDKNLTGEQTQELVQKIKSEPRFTIEEAYNTIKVVPPKLTPVKKEPIEIVISEAEQLIKTLEEIKPATLNKESKKNLHIKLLEVQNKIKSIIKSIVTVG